MYTSTLSIKFKTIASPAEKKVDFLSLVKTPYNYIRMLPTGDDRSAGLAYTFAPYFNAEDVITIDNGVSDIRENKEKAEKGYTRIFNTRNFIIQFRNFLITHVFKAGEDGFTPTPLFWKHVLSGSADDIDLTTIKILDSNLNEVSTDKWESQVVRLNTDDSSDSVILLNNLESAFSAKTGKYSVYYVVYTKTDGQYIYSLLNNSPIYLQRTLENLNYAYQYNVTNTGSSSFYGVNISGSIGSLQLKFAIKQSKEARIYGKHPLQKEVESSWHLRLNNGRFRRSNTYAGNVFYYTYSISEFEDQPFAPMEPYRRYSNISADVLNNNLLYTDCVPIAFSSSGLNLDIIVKDKSSNLRFALTTDSSKTYYVDYDPLTNNRQVVQFTYVSTDYVSIDQTGGFIYLGPYTVDIDDQVSLDLYRTEDSYELFDLELNPSFAPSILEQSVVVFLVPWRQDSTEPEETVMWLLFDNSGQVIDYNDSSIAAAMATYINTNGYADWLYNYTCSGVLHLYTEEVKVTSTGDNTVELETSFPVFDIETVILNDFPFAYTNLTLDSPQVISFTIGEDTPSLGFDLPDTTSVTYNFNPDNIDQFLVLCDITSRSPISPIQLSLFDIRENGGGIKEEEKRKAIETNEEVLQYWDIGSWDANPVPGMGVERVDIPWFITPPNEEDMSSSEVVTNTYISTAIKAREALGNYSLKRVWGPQPTVVDFAPASTSISITLSDEDRGTGLVKYYVKYTNTPSQIDSFSVPIQITSAERQYTISGLKRGTVYTINTYCSVTLDNGLTWRDVPNYSTIEIKTMG